MASSGRWLRAVARPGRPFSGCGRVRAARSMRLARRAPGEALRDHIAKLSGAVVTGYLTDQISEGRITFRYRGHSFGANSQHGEWLFSVEDPAFPGDILRAVADHCAAYLDPDRADPAA